MSEKYMKIVMLGTGTFGQAWLVTSVCSKRNYVMKEVKVSEMTEVDIKKTQIEATVLARCKHVNIVRYKESFLRGDPLTMCLVMEYADGGDLSMQVQYAKQLNIMIPEASILYWFVQVVFAVQYLHSNDILHRDLKTQNIFLTRSNMVKVGDFGIARFLRGKQDLATTATGTPYYLSPEICQRKPYNYKSDMWAVGCILYELCTLSHPFEADDFDVLSWKIMSGFYPPISSTYSELIHKLVAVFLRKDPEKRPSADQILVVPALRQLVQQYIEKHEKFLGSHSDSSSSSGKKSCSHCGCCNLESARRCRKSSACGSDSPRSRCSPDEAQNISVSSPGRNRRSSRSSESSCESKENNRRTFDPTYENIEILLKEKLSKTSFKENGCPSPPFVASRTSSAPQEIKFSAYGRSPPPAPPPSPSPQFGEDLAPVTPPPLEGRVPPHRDPLCGIPIFDTPTRQVLMKSVQTQTPPQWKSKGKEEDCESSDSGKDSDEVDGLRSSAPHSEGNAESRFYPKFGMVRSCPNLKETYKVLNQEFEMQEQFKIDL